MDVVDKETLKVLLKAPTETIGGMNVVISWCIRSPHIRAICGKAEYSSTVTCSLSSDLPDDLVFSALPAFGEYTAPSSS